MVWASCAGSGGREVMRFMRSSESVGTGSRKDVMGLERNRRGAAARGSGLADTGAGGAAAGRSGLAGWDVKVRWEAERRDEDLRGMGRQRPRK